MDSDEVIYSDNYTRVIAYQQKSFTIGDISLAFIGGIQWNAVLPAVGRSLIVALPFAVILPMIGHNILWAFWAILIPPGPAAFLYWRLAKERQGGLSEPQRRRLRRNHRNQPRHLLGLADNTEPMTFHWQLILFEPPAPQRRSTIFSLHPDDQGATWHDRRPHHRPHHVRRRLIRRLPFRQGPSRAGQLR